MGFKVSVNRTEIGNIEVSFSYNHSYEDLTLDEVLSTDASAEQLRIFIEYVLNDYMNQPIRKCANVPKFFPIERPIDDCDKVYRIVTIDTYFSAHVMPVQFSSIAIARDAAFALNVFFDKCCQMLLELD